MADYNAIKKKTDELAKKSIEAYNKVRDEEVLATEKIYDKQIIDSDASFDKVYDQANVQRIVNERFAAEAAANMGLSKSGYNRNRQTQIKLAYGNAVLETDLQKTAAANTIRQQLATYKIGVESEKSQNALNTQNSYDQLAQESYDKQYAAEKQAEAARISAQRSLNNQMQSDLSALKKLLISEDYSDKQKALEINSFCRRYDADASEFLDYIGMSGSLYFNYVGIPTQVPQTPSMTGLKYGYTNDYGTVIPGRNGFSVVYSDGTIRPATSEEIKAGKSLTPKPIANTALPENDKAITKSSAAPKSAAPKSAAPKSAVPTWMYHTGIGS